MGDKDEEIGKAVLNEIEREAGLGDLPKAVRQRLEAFIPELVKKTFTAGMGAVFTTEEGIRRVTKDMTLPKEVAGYLANTASTTKDELVKIIAREVREFLESVNLSEEIAKMLTMLSFEIKTEIRFIPNEEKYGGVEPDVKSKVRLKRSQSKRRSLRKSLRERLGTTNGDAEDIAEVDEEANAEPAEVAAESAPEADE